ncbi:ATP synthase protein I [Oceanococcus atlanticus]|uniref:ATP synthase protein I n=1 Tax=Oceanococcus atlanticus TaxID=1317117 RepID=A0A1Y1SB87_9GAMM|nr:ATP synthase subunit I [Oceanococcus atlanticus]ORE85404.1 ATP synthase protein I [Oceanococcus atlanticus]RZO84538.1 MAG: ATP synthase subunit I [Oceanococcus sp.]
MQQASKIIAMQCLIGMVVAAAWLAKSQTAALAALCGVGTAVLPAAYMRWRLLQALSLVDEPKRLVGTVYRGEFGKFALTFVLFALCMARFPTEFMAVMSAFVACLMAYIVGGLLVDHESLDG